MKHFRLSSPICVFGLLSLLTLSGCNKQGKSDESSSGESQSSKAKASDADGKACEKLAKKLCDELGEDDPTCESAEIAFKLLADGACSAGLKDFAGTKTKLKAQAKKCDVLEKKLCAKLGEESDSCATVKERTEEIPPAHCAMMLDHIDEIVADLKAEELADQPLGKELQAKIAASSAPSFGPADAKVTVVEFSDFECPYCSGAARVTSQIKKKYDGKVRVVFRHFPLDFHENAKLAAQASLAANAQGKFWEFHDKLFQNQENLDRSALEGFAKELGLDVGKFKAALDDAQNAKKVEADIDLGAEVAVDGTPTMFVNGERIGNPTDFDEVAAAIDSALGS